jgi:hypothetical protein
MNTHNKKRAVSPPPPTANKHRASPKPSATEPKEHVLEKKDLPPQVAPPSAAKDGRELSGRTKTFIGWVSAVVGVVVICSLAMLAILFVYIVYEIIVSSIAFGTLSDFFVSDTVVLTFMYLLLYGVTIPAGGLLMLCLLIHQYTENGFFHAMIAAMGLVVMYLWLFRLNGYI